MIYSKGKLYAIDIEDLLVFDIVDELDRGEPRVSQIKLVIKGEPLPYDRNSLQVPYLLESHGTLLLVRRKVPYKLEKGNRFRRTAYIGVGDTNEFEVFEADCESRLWVEVRGLVKGQALFIGQGCSRAIDMSPYDQSGDSIFFLDDYAHIHTGLLWKKTTTSCGVYDMKDGRVHSPLPMVSWKLGDVSATWLFSQGKTDK
ncbi:hypothetical protein ACP70R_020192 [Stipagrostis hirtigluma subsp. patula]